MLGSILFNPSSDLLQKFAGVMPSHWFAACATLLSGDIKNPKTL